MTAPMLRSLVRLSRLARVRERFRSCVVSRSKAKRRISVAQRTPLSRNGSRRLFTATASKTHYLNVKPRPQRGGIRL